MTPRESVEKILAGETGHKIPLTIYENKIPQCAAERTLRNQGLCIVRRDVPVFNIIYPNVTTTTATYTQDGKNLIKTQYQTPVGTLDTIAEPAGFTTWTHKRLFTSPKDYKPLLFLVNDMQFEPNYEAFKAAQEADGGDCFFRGQIGSEPMQTLISDYMGTETFGLQWYDNRDELLKLYQAIAAKRQQVYTICADSPAMAFNYGGNVTPEILGLERFEKYYIPHYNQAADILHKKGKLIGVHFDANCKILANTIADSNLDYIEAFTPSPDTDMTVADARKAWPDKTLWINFPSSVHLQSIEYIKKTTQDILDQAGSAGKFIMGITEDVPEDRWRQNLLAISEVLNKNT